MPPHVCRCQRTILGSWFSCYTFHLDQAWWQVPFPLSYLTGPKKSFLVKTSNGSVTNVLFFHTRLLFLTRKLQPKLKILEHLSSLGFKSLAVVGVFTLWGSSLF